MACRCLSASCCAGVLVSHKMVSDGVSVPGFWRWSSLRNRGAAYMLALLLMGGMLGQFVSLEKPFSAATLRGKLVVAVPPRPAPLLTVGHVDRALRSPDPLSAALAISLGERLGLPVELLLGEPGAAATAVATGK